MEPTTPDFITYKPQITVTSQKEAGIIVPISRWARLKKRVRQCKSVTNRWENAAWTFGGIFLPSAIQAILDNRERLTLSGATVLALLSLALCVTSVLAYNSEKRHQQESIDSVVDELEEIESQFIAETVAKN